MTTKAQQRANTKYRAKTYKMYQFSLRKDTQQNLIKKLDAKENKSAYIVGLIEKDK